MIPRHNNPLTAVPRIRVHPTLTYQRRERPRTSEHDPFESRITNEIDGLESIYQAIKHILMTERGKYRIYPLWYGVELDQYLKKPFGYFCATIKQTLENALLADDRMHSVTINRAWQVDIDAAAVDFTVHTNLGNISMRAEVALTV